MPNNSKQNRRMVVTVAIVLAVAFAGLAFTNVGLADGHLDVTKGTQSAAAETPQTTTSPTMPTGDLLPAIIKMVSALALVIAVVYGGLYLLKRLTRRGGRGSGEVLQILETTYVGPHKAVSLVRVADRSVLIGVTDHQVSVLTELDAEETAAICHTETASKAAESFGGSLVKAMSKLKEMGTGRKQTVLET